MCYNCGCGLPDDDMGQGHAKVDPHGKSITNKTFEKLAGDWGKTSAEVKEMVYASLIGGSLDEDKTHQMGHLYEEAAKSQGMSVDQSKEETERLLKKVLKK